MVAQSDLIGRRMPRVEDEPLLRGQGRFVDDLNIPGALHAAFLRSGVAHARLKSIDADAARALPGVVAVLTFADLRPLLTSDRIPQALPAGAIKFDVDPYALAKDEVSYVGEPIAMVVAESRRVAEDALALIALDLEALPAVLDPVDGLAPGAPKARLDCPDNLVARQSIDYGDVDGGFAKASHRIAERFRLHKGGGHSIETRGVAVRFDDTDGSMTVFVNSQTPHRAKQILVAALGLAEQQICVVAPDTGGGFGPKATFYPEELALPAAALNLRRPLKWIEDRRESFVATGGERDMVWDMEMAVDNGGRILALRGKLFHDHGACTPYGVALAYNAATNVVGPYVLPAYRLDIHWCLTNVVPCVPTRGAGRPQGMYVMERLLDRVAERLVARARRGAAAQSDPSGANALRDADPAARRLDHDLRQRRLSGEPASRARRLRLDGFSGAAGGGAQGWAPPRSRPCKLCRRHRSRPVRERRRARRRLRPDRRHHRRQRARPRRQDHAQPIGERRARRAGREHRRDHRRHRRRRRWASARSPAARP